MKWINNYEFLTYFPIDHDSCTEFDYISPKLAKCLPIQLDSKGNMFWNAMVYYGANLCVEASTNMDTNNIFQFLTIF